MNNKEKRFLDEVITTLPNYNYINGVAYEIRVDTPHIVFRLNKQNESLVIESNSDIELSPEFLQEVHSFMITNLNQQRDSNKSSWYYYSTF